MLSLTSLVLMTPTETIVRLLEDPRDWVTGCVAPCFGEGMGARLLLTVFG